MSNYKDIIYPNDEHNTYPRKLIQYLYTRFMKDNLKHGAQRKILDIGCCTGAALKMFAEHEDLDLYGVDIRDENIDGITFKTCNIENEALPFPDNTFDFIYNKSVLEHVMNTDQFLKESRRVLKPGGMFIGLTPDWGSQQYNFWDDYTHVKPFTRKGLRDALKIHDFDEADCEFFYQLPFLWKYPWLEFVSRLIALLPNSWKWKDRDERNTKDRKLIRFSKEKMLLSYGIKGEQE